MFDYEMIEVFPENPLYVRGSHFFKGLQIMVVENLDDFENNEYQTYQQPICTFYGPTAKDMAEKFLETLMPIHVISRPTSEGV